MAFETKQILWLHQKQQRRQQPESEGLSLETHTAGTTAGLWSSVPVLQATQVNSDPDVMDCRELHSDVLLYFISWKTLKLPTDWVKIKGDLSSLSNSKQQMEMTLSKGYSLIWSHWDISDEWAKANTKHVLTFDGWTAK